MIGQCTDCRNYWSLIRGRMRESKRKVSPIRPLSSKARTFGESYARLSVTHRNEIQAAGERLHHRTGPAERSLGNQGPLERRGYRKTSERIGGGVVRREVGTARRP